jgi:hypothetical protein
MHVIILPSSKSADAGLAAAAQSFLARPSFSSAAFSSAASFGMKAA